MNSNADKKNEILPTTFIRQEMTIPSGRIPICGTLILCGGIASIQKKVKKNPLSVTSTSKVNTWFLEDTFIRHLRMAGLRHSVFN